MGLFDFFGKKSGEGVLKKHASRVGDKRAQAPDRWDSIQALGGLIAAAKPKPAKAGEAEALPDGEALKHASSAVEALLARFTFSGDPSITDQEEKEEVSRLIAGAGEPAIAPVVAFLRRSESIGWPLKLLERLVPADRVVNELLDVLGTMDTEYARDPQRKIQLLQALEERKDARIAEVVSRFVEDVNESARFHAAGAIFVQEDASPAREAMTKRLGHEDSVRVRAALLDGFAARGWDVGAERAKIERALPAGFTIDKAGIPKQRA